MKIEDIKVLVCCEESQAVTIAFRERGFEAYSNDIQKESGGHPEVHLQMDCFEAIELIKPTLLIGHPPCTFLTVTANKWLKDQELRKSGALVGQARREAKKESITFFMKMYNSNVKHIALENPIGCMSSVFRQPDQIIHPYYFGDTVRKATCLWLKNLPLLFYSKHTDLFNEKTSVEPDIYVFKNGKGTCDKATMYDLSQGDDRAKIRSKTYPGFATQMATQSGR